MSNSVIHSVKFDDQGLVATIVQDADSNEVLAFCYLDGATLATTLQTGRITALETRVANLGQGEWRLRDLRANLDGHSLTVLVERQRSGTAGEQTRHMVGSAEVPPSVRTDVSLIDVDAMEFGVAINSLYQLIEERNEKRPEGSYTTYLLNSGLDKILKKIAEESGEVIIAAKNKSSREIVSELADLFYHLLVLMVEREVRLEDVRNELVHRSRARTESE